MSVNNHRKCAKCGRTRAEDMTVTYHRFPNPGIANITKARAWAKFCWPNEDFTSVEILHSLHITSKVLCGRHFKLTQFYDNKRQKLSKFAVPDSTEVEELLNDRENILNQDDQLGTSKSTLDYNNQMPRIRKKSIETDEENSRTSCNFLGVGNKIGRRGASTDVSNCKQTSSATNSSGRLYEDECDMFGHTIALQLRSLNDKQRSIAEKLISDILFYSRTDVLTEDTKLKNLIDSLSS